MDTESVAVLGHKTGEPPVASPRHASLVEPNPKDVVLVSYGPGLDAFVAAWVVRINFKKHNIPAEFEVITESNLGGDATGRNWVTIGATAPRADHVAKSALWIHTKMSAGGALPFSQWKRTFPFGIETMAPDGSRVSDVYSDSLALAAWNFFNAHRVGFEKPPRLIQHLNDRETKAFKFKDTPDVMACVDSYSDGDFVIMDKLVEVCEDRVRRQYMIAAGQGINRIFAKIAAQNGGKVKIEVEK